MKKQRMELRINNLLCLSDFEAEIIQNDKRNEFDVIISSEILIKINHKEPLTINIDKGIDYNIKMTAYKKVFKLFERFQNAMEFYKCKLKIMKKGYLEFGVFYDNKENAFGMYSPKKLKI